MKRFAAAIILVILCFNWFGYSSIISFMQRKADVQMEAMLDKKSIKETDLFELKIPLHLPYQTSWANYERYDGEVKLNGTIYKYVKRKITDDTLHLMCIKNTKKMEYENAKRDFYKNTNDLSSNNSQKTPSLVFKKIGIESDHFLFDMNMNHQTTLVEQDYFSVVVGNASEPHLISPKQPPDGTLA